MVTEVRSPVSRPGSKIGSIRSGDLSPGARSMPSAGDRGRRDNGNSAPEPSYEPAAQRTRDRRDAEQHEQQPEREQRERADSVGVFGLIKRLLPSRQRPTKPYVFRAFPTSSDW